ncbi:MAG: hypothetical protein MI784_16335, partial [Cytophagales bacterium]|nr:hypothetical protein [Cytophagales bacterium]
ILISKGYKCFSNIAELAKKDSNEFIVNYGTKYNAIRKEYNLIEFDEKIFKLYKSPKGYFKWSKHYGDIENYPYLEHKYTQIKDGLIVKITKEYFLFKDEEEYNNEEQLSYKVNIHDGKIYKM